MSVYVANISATLLTCATKFKVVKNTGESVSRIGFKREAGETT